MTAASDITPVQARSIDHVAVACALCGAHKSTPVLRGPDRLHGIPGVWTLVRCAHCGLVYQTPRPPDDQIGALYPSTYEPFQTTLDAEGYIPKDIRRTAAFVNALKPEGGLLLDVGCGAGDFLVAMERLFPAWQVQGVEPSAVAVDRARARGLDVQHGSLHDVPHTLRPDAIALWNVLEHVPDPRALLTEIAQRLAPNGVLCLAVPLHDSWDARVWGPYWVGWEVPRHLYAFDRASITRVLEAAGFTIVRQACVSGTHYGMVQSAVLAIDAATRSYAVRRIARTLLFGQPFRVVIKPYMLLPERARRGTVLTIAARRTGERP